MKIQLKTLAATAALITGIISAPAAYADGDRKSSGSMMGQGGMMQGGQGGQMGMMNMMGQMSQMMATCNQMMQAMMQHQQEKSQKPGQTPKKNKG